MTVIYRQLIMNDISLFTSQPKAKFYDELFIHLNLDSIPDRIHEKGRQGYSRHAMICAAIVKSCECFEYVTDLVDFLNNNLIIAYYCGFDLTKKLPAYHAFERFFKNFEHTLLQKLMTEQVQNLYELKIVDASFIAIDSTPMSANTKQNNPKSFCSGKYAKENHPKSDPDCGLGVHTASNQHDERKFEYYWGYKSHVVVDCISGLPLFEKTTTADVNDGSAAVELLKNTDAVIPVKECTLIADKAYDIKEIYNTVRNVYNGDCVIPLNQRNTKNPKKLGCGNIICEAGLAMHKDGKDKSGGRTRQKYCCPFKNSKDDSACSCCHKNYMNEKKNRGCTKYVTLPDDYRLSIDRTAVSFKKIYAMRSEIERYNARFKATGLERLWIRSENAVKNMATLAHIALLAVATSAVLTQRPHLKLSKKSFMRFA